MAFTNHAILVVTANGKQALAACDEQQFPPEMQGRTVPPMLPRPHFRPDSVLLPCAHVRAACETGGAIPRGADEPAECRTGFSMTYLSPEHALARGRGSHSV